MTATDVLLQGLQTTLWVSLLTVLVLVLRRPATKHFGSRAAMLLWAIPAARLVVPALPREVVATADQAVLEPAAHLVPDPLPAEPSLHQAALTQPSGRANEAWQAPLVHTEPAVPEGPGILAPLADLVTAEHLAALVLVLWFVGAVAAGTIGVLRLASWRRTLLAEAVEVPGETAELARRMALRAGTQKSFDLILSRAAESPQILGFKRPVLALPTDFAARYDRSEQEMALLHEITHLKRGDLSVLVASEAGFALQWFNPLTRQARRALRADQEAACDEAVRSLGVSTKSYAALLLKAARAQRPVPAFTLDHGLKERIVRMQNPVGAPMKRKAFASVAAISALLLAGFTASRTEIPADAASQDVEPSREAEALVDALNMKAGRQEAVAKSEASRALADRVRARAERREREGRRVERSDTRIITGNGHHAYSSESGWNIQLGTGDRGFVLLNNPFTELEAEMPTGEMPQPPAPAVPDQPPVRQKKDEEGTWILIPDTPDMSAFEAKMARFEERMEAWGEKMEAWGEKMGHAGEAIGELAEACADHQEDSDAPVILEEPIEDSSQTVRAVCVAGGDDRLASREVERFLEGEGVSTAEMRTFRRQLRNR